MDSVQKFPNIQIPKTVCHYGDDCKDLGTLIWSVLQHAKSQYTAPSVKSRVYYEL